LLQYLSPKNTEDISIKIGNSIVNNGTIDFTSKSSFQYVKNLTYEQYLNLSTEIVNGVVYRVLPCYFVTNVENSASTVYVYNKFFNLAWDSFTNIESAKIVPTMSGERYYGTGQTVTISFTTNKTGRYRVEVTENNGKSIHYIDVNNTSGEKSITYNTITWNSQIGVKIIYENDGVEVELVGNERNILFFKPKSINKGNNNTEFRLRSGSRINNNSSWNSAYKLGTKSTILTNGCTVEIDNLQATSKLYLCYKSGNNYYNVELKASELVNQDLDITF
jgi:hypothetical protein